MTTVYFVRHCEAEGNILRIAQGHTDAPITEKGRAQIAALRERFADIAVDAVYSSDLIRARTTAEAIYVPKGLPLHTDPAFREINLGPWEGVKWDDLTANYPEMMDAFNHHMENFHVVGAETAQDVIDRFYPALMTVVRANEGKTVAICSHGCAMRIMLTTLKGLPISAIGKEGHSDNTAVSRLEFDGESVRVVYQDDNSHLLRLGLSTLADQHWWKE